MEESTTNKIQSYHLYGYVYDSSLLKKHLKEGNINNIAQIDGFFVIKIKLVDTSIIISSYPFSPIFFFNANDPLINGMYIADAISGKTRIDTNNINTLLRRNNNTYYTTIYNNVSILPPGHKLEIGTNKLYLTHTIISGDLVLHDPIKSNVRILTKNKFMLSLSAGYDSRVILSIAKSLKLKYFCKTTAIEESEEHKIVDNIILNMNIEHTTAAPLPTANKLHKFIKYSSGIIELYKYPGFDHIFDCDRKKHAVFGFGGDISRHNYIESLKIIENNMPVDLQVSNINYKDSLIKRYIYDTNINMSLVLNSCNGFSPYTSFKWLLYLMSTQHKDNEYPKSVIKKEYKELLKINFHDSNDPERNGSFYKNNIFESQPFIDLWQNSDKYLRIINKLSDEYGYERINISESNSNEFKFIVVPMLYYAFNILR